MCKNQQKPHFAHDRKETFVCNVRLLSAKYNTEIAIPIAIGMKDKKHLIFITLKSLISLQRKEKNLGNISITRHAADNSLQHIFKLHNQHIFEQISYSGNIKISLCNVK